MSPMRAVVPPSILKRWDLIAAAQLCSAASRLSGENDELRERVYSAEDAAQHWRDNAMELAGDDAGLTIDGRLIRLQDFDGRPFADQRFEYLRDAAFSAIVRGAQ